jgi:hypothetical protein
MLNRRIILLALLALPLLWLCSCNDDDDCPTCPGEVTPSLENLWPHADGTDWSYDFRYRVHELETSVGDTLPGMSTLHAALLEPVASALVSEDEGIYRQTVNGTVTTDSDVTAINMDVTIYSEVYGDKSLSPDNALLGAIARARPDLREKLEDRLGRRLADKDLDEAGFLFFLSPYAFAVEDSGYFGYGDLSTEHSWIYLTDELEVGSEFSIRLVPQLADDLWLYGRIWSVGDFTSGGATYANAVECMYVMDLGIQISVDEQGDIISTHHAYCYGRTVFVPEIGPVYCQERRILTPDDLIQDPDPMPTIADCTCVLIR